jgi:multidrug efflux system outer membrane protein
VSRGAAFLLAGLLAACAGQRPAAPPAAAVIPPQTWRVADVHTSAELNSAWWRGFGDPELTRVVETALANNVDIATAVSRVEEARAQFRGARGQLLPGVELGAAGQRDRFLDPFGSAADETAEQAKIGISYDLDLFGRLRDSTEATRKLFSPHNRRGTTWCLP